MSRFNTVAIAALISILSVSEACENLSHLFVVYDAGETTNLIPVMKALEKKHQFKVLTLATAETLISENSFKGKRITLKELSIEDKIDKTTQRTVKLSKEALTILQQTFNPERVVVGSASAIQAQLLTLFPQAKTFAFIDNFNYDPKHESFKTVKEVQKVAQTVLCPSVKTIAQFKESDEKERWDKYQVVGKPSLEAWEKEISQADLPTVLEKLGLEINGKPIIVFIGGYGEGYDFINPLFKSCKEILNTKGYQVIIQPHPKVEPQKVKTTEALALCKATGGIVIGYNSSVPFDAAVIGLNALYMLPDNVPSYSHFAISDGFIESVKSCDDLLSKINSFSQPKDLKTALKIPKDSKATFLKIITEK